MEGVVGSCNAGAHSVAGCAFEEAEDWEKEKVGWGMRYVLTEYRRVVYLQSKRDAGEVPCAARIAVRITT